MTNDALTNLINKLIDDQLDRGQRVVANWIVHHVEQSIAAPDPVKTADARRVAIHEGVRQRAGDIIRNRKENGPDDARFPALPGYERLQRCYIVKTVIHEKGEPPRIEEQIVRAVDMDLNDWLAKLAELEGQRDGISVHIDEIQRYIEDK